MENAYSAAVQSLPVTPYLDAVCTALKSSPSHFLILTAETAAGKSTAVPLALLRHFDKKILMLEPRRLAALAVASRVSELLGEKNGGQAGYIMHLETCLSARTRFVVMTEAVLTRMLQDDPSLDGVSVVVLDEFHERSVHTDLALAFLKECMEIRDDLFVIVMSATIETGRLAVYLGTGGSPAPVFRVPGRQFPVSVEYAGNISASDAVQRELGTKEKGSILVFLPGIAAIRRTAEELARQGADADIQILHSSVNFEEQKKILTPPAAGSRRRVILSSAIAETSLTVPGVTVVIDSGLARINRMNIAAGMETLSTENESVFSAAQRRGRAGRVCPGRCVCLWNENDARTAVMPPEILRTDLTPLVLECAQWGVYDPDRLAWLDRPSDASWNGACSLLEQLGCLAQKGSGSGLQITSLGKAALSVGLHPRLACAALAGGNNFSGAAARYVLQYSPYAGSAPAVQRKFCADIEQRVKKCGAMYPDMVVRSVSGKDTESVLSVGTTVLLAGFPDRIAHLQNVSGVYQFPSGRIASLPVNERRNSSGFSEWIIAPEADAGEREGRIYQYEALPQKEAEKWLAAHAVTYTECKFENGPHTLRKTEYHCYGRLVISSRKINPELNDFVDAVCGAVEKNGISWLPLAEKTKEFLLRAQFYEENSNSPDRKTDPSSLRQSVREWLPPFLTECCIPEDAVYEALRCYLDGGTIDKNVPLRIIMPNGKSYKLTYEPGNGRKDRENDVRHYSVRPVLEIIIQRIFGCIETPRIMGVPVLLKLLSPANRPLQITDDLAGFWQNTWPEICKEMKGRYPKHNWDYREIDRE
ncbi:MAG: ATP-dependent helicase HrpB [Treponema sp.]|nr:ATP-dependent helicase HrpB [Treponema sp.]